MVKKEEFKYWPKDFIPVISELVLPMLDKDDYHEEGQNLFLNEVIKLTILDKNIIIPKYLTSPRALTFLGFTESRARILWRHLKNVATNEDGPNVEGGSGFYFWRDLIKILEKQIIDTMENKDMHNIAYSRKVLDNIGLTNEVQLQDIKVTTGYGEATLNLRAQIPKDTIPLAKQYITHRWKMLTQLSDIITKKEDWRKEVMLNFAQGPIGLTSLHLPEFNPWDLGYPLISDKEPFNKSSEGAS